jgi:phospholipid/cholesterol/gamma-HCH transport system substrate-binding protein
VPSQRQLRWSELRVGITVVVAAITLAVLVFFMSGTAGLFTSKITLFSYYDNAEGLRVGAPVALQGVTIGNVKEIRVVPGRQLDPVQVTMKVNTKYRFLLRKDSSSSIQTVGVLGESFIDIDSKTAKGKTVDDGDILPATNAPALQDVVRSSQTTLQNLDILIKRLDRIVAAVENGQGSVGKIINDPSLFNRANSLLAQMQQIVNDVSNGKGSIGKLLSDDELYRKANDILDKVNRVADEVNRSEGSLGKFIHDPSLYQNANQTISKANQLMDNINAGHGTIGKLAKDEEFARKLDNTITKVSALADKLNSGEGTAGKFVQDPSMYNNTDQLLVETRGLIKAIRENPKKYLTIHLKLF